MNNARWLEPTKGSDFYRKTRDRSRQMIIVFSLLSLIQIATGWAAEWVFFPGCVLGMVLLSGWWHRQYRVALAREARIARVVGQ